jgi:hypothetical protein
MMTFCLGQYSVQDSYWQSSPPPKILSSPSKQQLRQMMVSRLASPSPPIREEPPQLAGLGDNHQLATPKDCSPEARRHAENT